MNQVNGEYNVSVWKSKGRYTSNLALFKDLTPIMKHFYYKKGLEFSNSILS